jgi:hypothetical protein
MMPPMLGGARLIRLIERWWPGLVFLAVTVVLFARPLLGLGSLLPVDIVELFAPWRHEPSGGPGTVHNILLSDTMDVHSHFASLSADIRAGNASWWDRSIGAGIPSSKAGFSPVLWGYLLVPAWYAPGLAAGVRTLVAAGLTYGLVRSLGAGKHAAVISGVAYALSGFMIGWAGWPQSNTAAFLPGVFWAAEALVRRSSWRSACGLGLASSAMIVSNFPVVTGYGILVGAGYALARLVQRRKQSGPWPVVVRDRSLRAFLGLGLGAGLASMHILHFGENLLWADTGPRTRIAADSSIGAKYLVSFLLPEPFGASHDGQVWWGSTLNWVETQSYAGLAVILLALVSLVTRSRGVGASTAGAERAAIVRTWWVIVVAVAWIAYVGGPLTKVLQSLPFLGHSTVGRARVVANLGLAVLAGLGVQAWADARAGSADVDVRRGLTRAAGWVSIGVIATTPFWWSWLSEARSKGFVTEVAADALIPVATGCLVVAALWWWRPATRGRGSAPLFAVLGVLVALELLVFAVGVNTVVDPDRVDLVTDAHVAAVDSLEPGERMAAEGRVFMANTGQVTGLDDVRGNLFTPPGWREVFGAVDPEHSWPPGSVSNPWFNDVDVFSTALDRLGVGVWAMGPHEPLEGARSDWIFASDEAPLVGADAAAGIGQGTVPAGGLRGITVDIVEAGTGTLWARVESGSDVVDGSVALTPDRTGLIDVAFVDGLAITGEQFRLTLWTVGPVFPRLSGTADGIAFGIVAGGDGLTVVANGSVVVYERPGALGARLVHAVDSVSTNASFHAGPLDVVAVDVAIASGIQLPTEPPAGADGHATVRVAQGDSIVIDVETTHPGVVVVAQPHYPGWTATIGGQPTEILRVDGGFPAILVPSGSSEVVMQFRPTYLTLATIITLMSVVAMVALWGWERRSDARN